jgi:two-component system sensor histidine kinase/response regulator
VHEASADEPDRRDAFSAHVGPLALVQETLGLVTWIWDIGQPPVWHGDLSPLLGLPRGDHRHDLPGWIERLHPDDRPAARDRFIACLKGRLPVYRAEERVLWPDGSVHWIETLGRGTYGPDGRATRLVGVVSDVTERKRNELALLATDARFRRVIEDAPIAIGIAHGRDSVWVNAAYLRLFGFDDAAQVVGTPVAARIAPESLPAHLARSERRLGGGEAETRYQFVALRRDGSRFIAQSTVTPTEFEGGQATLAFLEDVSERVRAAQELQDLNASLERRVAERTAELEAINAQLADARDAAEAATRAKSAFLANMSHEIRTPLNAIVGLTGLTLRAADVPDGVRTQLGRTQHAAGLLLAIVNDILDYSRLEAGRVAIDAVPYALADAIDRVVAVVTPGAAAKGLALRVVLAPELPARLRGDPLRVAQVLLNLCGNAVKFTDRGEVVLRAGIDAGPRLRLEVEDSGVGIAPAHLERLFEPFEQLDVSATRRHGGSGLGLAISRGLVAAMGGTLDVRSTPGRGSVFRVQLPLEAADDVPPPAPAAPAVDGTLRGRRILLVEDNELNRVVAVELLSRIGGAEVEVAVHGAEALERLAAARFDLVLMDVQMPVMDGLAATALLRRNPAHAGLPVLAMTAHALAEDRAACLAAGMNDVVGKPVDVPELFAALRRWLPAPA